MDPQIIAAVVTVLLTAGAGAGAAGYFIKSWLTHSRPFVRIVAVNGGFTRAATDVEIPEPLVRSLATVPAGLLNALSSTETLSEVYQTHSAAIRFDQSAPQLLEYLESFERAVVAGETSSATSMLSKVL